MKEETRETLALMPLPLFFSRPADAVAVSSDPIKKYFHRSCDRFLSPSSPERIEGMFTRVVELKSKSGKSENPRLATGTSVRLDMHQSWFRENRSVIRRAFI
jgi:hypothetical protein